MAFDQLRAPISDIRSNSYAGSGSRVLTDPTGERKKRQFRQRFRDLQSCRPNPSGKSGIIRDNGPGIPDHIKDELFQTFSSLSRPARAPAWVSRLTTTS